MIKMFHKKLGKVVDVVKIIETDNSIKAIIWDDRIKDPIANSGWSTCKISTLVPFDYYMEHKECFITPEEREDLKKRIKSEKNSWTTSDGQVFNDYNKALLHERSVIKNKIRALLSANGSI